MRTIFLKAFNVWVVAGFLQVVIGLKVADEVGPKEARPALRHLARPRSSLISDRRTPVSYLPTHREVPDLNVSCSGNLSCYRNTTWEPWVEVKLEIYEDSPLFRTSPLNTIPGVLPNGSYPGMPDVPAGVVHPKLPKSMHWRVKALSIAIVVIATCFASLRAYKSFFDSEESLESAWQYDASPRVKFTKWEAVTTLSNLMCGGCLLTVPFCITRTGQVGLFAFIVVAALMAGSALLIGRCLEKIYARNTARRPDWVHICYAAFGKSGVVLAFTIVPIDLLFRIINSILVAGHLLPAVLPQGTVTLGGAMVVCGCLSAVLCSVPTRGISGIASFGAGAEFCIVCFLILTGFILFVVDAETVETEFRFPHLGDSRVLSVFGIFFSSFNVHSMLPYFYSRLEDRQQWDSVVVLSTLMAVTVCASVGLICYVLFGVNTKQVFAENMGENRDGELIYGFGFMRTWCCGMIVVQQLTIVPPGWMALKSMVVEKMPSLHGKEAWLGLVVLALATIASVAWQRVMPYVLAMEGDFVDFPMAIFIPTCAYLYIFRKTLSFLWKAGLILVLTFACLLVVPGELFDLQILCGVHPGLIY